MIAAGTTICTERQMAGESVVHAVCQFSVVQFCGRFHARAGLASPAPLKLVTNSTYTGTSTISTKSSSATYLAVRPTVKRSRGPRRPRSTGVPLVPVGVAGAGPASTAVIASPIGSNRSGTAR